MANLGLDDYGMRRGALLETKVQEVSPKLKQISGLVQGLSYREMKEFAAQIACGCPNDGPETITEALLAASDHFIKK